LSSKRTITIALASASLAATALIGNPTAVADSTGRAAVSGLDGVRGFDIGASGRTVVAEADGTVSRVFRVGKRAGQTQAIAKVRKDLIGSAVAVADDNAVWILTSGGEGVTPGMGSLFLKRPGHAKRLVVNVQRWQGNHNPDPFDLEGLPKDSNPYGVDALPDGSALVADAANNSVVRVWRNGKVKAIARVKPRVVEMPAGIDDPQLPPAGTPLPAEAVITSVAHGPDGSTYIGELRGFPATPGTSEIWRIRPGATGAICRPNKPQQGACRRVADGLTSIVSLEVGRFGSIYAAELSKMSWLAIEGEPPAPGSEIGAVIRINHDRNVRKELSPGKVVLPGAVAVGPRGGVFVSGPIFGPGGLMRVR
jgi:hypothetical protein